MSLNDILVNIANNINANETETATSSDFGVGALDINVDDTTEVMDFLNEQPPQMLPPEASARTNPTMPKRKRLAREVQSLAFDNPGSEMSRFLPDTIDIVNGSRTRRREAVPKNTYEEVIEDDCPIYHDRNGKIVTNGEPTDLCDCLQIDCSGCQWPCFLCKSRKCGSVCRQNRKEIITKIEALFTVNGQKDHEISINPCFNSVD